MRLPRILLAAAVAASLAGPGVLGGPAAQAASAGPDQIRLSWEARPTGSTARLRGLAAVSRDIAWATGSAGAVLRTVDGGRSWHNVPPPGTGGLEFRDVEAFDADNAVILSIGANDASRVYRTHNGGKSWTLAFRNDDPKAFYDCMAFFDHKRGMAVSDPVEGRFRILSTGDGGYSWRVMPSAGMPAALDGEAAFAASGQCLVTRDDQAWLASGGGASSRVFRSRDAGRTWSVSTAPLPSGATQGIFGLAFRDVRHGVAVGGDYRPGVPSPNAAVTTGDAGRRWTAADRPPPAYRSGVAWLSGYAAVAVGPTGSEVTFTGGRTWRPFDTTSFDTVGCTAHGACWASGEQGKAARLRP
ncbi:MAG: putative oxidoreductase [Streptosporangiaceae bacterium]|jgi:photosystem II stability/assembly factor-like uncharacterized protein|nr:putative oxidoreductase [Streptosporangiaceae bacterium]